MARIELATQVTDDLERILEHLALHKASEPSAHILDIVAAIEVLERNPLIGRAFPSDLR